MRARVLLLLTACATGADIFGAESGRLTLEISETAGVHRDHAPVHVLLRLPQSVPSSTSFRLLDHGRPVVAQFRPHGTETRESSWWLDFLASSAPFEKRVWQVEYGPDTEPVPERTTGHVLEQTDDAFVITNAPWIEWNVPRSFEGFLSSVEFPPAEHLKPGSVGFTVRDRDGTIHRLGGSGTKATVVRHGRMTVGLQFEKTESVTALKGVSWSATLTFPGPISWVDTQLTLNDPENRVAETGMQLQLNLDAPTPQQRTLVELGADRTVYRSLWDEAQVELRAQQGSGPAWQVLRTVQEKLTPFVVASDTSPPAEGWAHVMDRRSCLAIAFQDFGTTTADRLNITANGTLTAVRRFPATASPNSRAQKHWRMWLHFVHFPPQQSAATDPQMMQNPLRVREVGQ